MALAAPALLVLSHTAARCMCRLHWGCTRRWWDCGRGSGKPQLRRACGVGFTRGCQRVEADGPMDVDWCGRWRDAGDTGSGLSPLPERDFMAATPGRWYGAGRSYRCALLCHIMPSCCNAVPAIPSRGDAASEGRCELPGGAWRCVVTVWRIRCSLLGNPGCMVRTSGRVAQPMLACWATRHGPHTHVETHCGRHIKSPRPKRCAIMRCRVCAVFR
mmetsp:Transcript_3625/g.7900  ORF Transcript_3625/g.7900 Transcript_3625/m.7900 type:complete len:216 (-) Transcript_3625:53-700(-)